MAAGLNSELGKQVCNPLVKEGIIS